MLLKKLTQMESEIANKSQEPTIDPAVANELEEVRNSLLKELKLKNSDDSCPALLNVYLEEHKKLGIQEQLLQLKLHKTVTGFKKEFKQLTKVEEAAGSPKKGDTGFTHLVNSLDGTLN